MGAKYWSFFIILVEHASNFLCIQFSPPMTWKWHYLSQFIFSIDQPNHVFYNLPRFSFVSVKHKISSAYQLNLGNSHQPLGGHPRGVKVRK
jgi:hypothetical protein